MLGRQQPIQDPNDGLAVRYEFEYQQGGFDITRFELGQLDQSASGTGRYQALTANIYLNKQWTEHWSTYAGVGLGWGKTNLPKIDMVAGSLRLRTRGIGQWTRVVRSLGYRVPF